MTTKSRYGDFRNCARCKGEINIADHCQLFLIRLDNYWHDYCFCCKHCHKQILDRKFTELEGHAWHKSCYKQQHQGQVSNIKPKNPLLSGIGKEMGKKMKIVMNGVGKKSKRQSHHVESNAVKETREAPNEENPRVENLVSSAGKLAQFDAVKETREAPNEENPRVENSVSSAGEPVNAAAQDLDAHGSNQAANQTNLSSTSTTKPQPNFDPNSLRPDLIPIYDEILAKHGDIIKNCTLRSKIFKSTYSNSLCSILKDLQTTQVCNFNECRLSEMLELLADMEKAGFDVEWLNAHLVKIKKFLELNKAYKTLEITREQQAKAVHLLKNSIDLKEEELSKLRSQFWEAKEKYDSIYHEIIVIKSSLDQCPMITLVDGLF